MTRAWRALWFALAVALLLRLPALRYGVLSDDEAIYHAMAAELRAGGVMYQTTVDHKPPGLAYTYAAAERVAVALGGTAEGLGMALVHLLGALFAAGTCLSLWGIARRVLAEPLWVYPPLLYAVVSTALQPVDGLAVNGELLMNLPLALGLWAALEGSARAGWKRAGFDLLAGVLCGAAALYKYQAAIAVLSLPLLCWPLSSWQRLRSAVQRNLLWAAGSLLPFALVAAFFHAHGALADAIRWGLRFNSSYIAEGAGLVWALGRLAPQLLGVVLPGAVLFVGGAVALVALVRGLLSRSAAAPPPGAAPAAPSSTRARAGQGDVVSAQPWLAAFALGSIAAVCVGGRFFGHYFLQAEVPLALLAAGPASRLGTRKLALGLGVPAAVFAAIALLPGLTQPIFNAEDPDYRAIGRAIEARTAPDDTIWVWGNVPQLYYSSARKPGVRFTFCNYLTGLSPATPSERLDAVDPRKAEVAWAWPLVLQDLERNRPALVLDTAAAGFKSYAKFPVARYPLLADYLSIHYQLEAPIGAVAVWRRR